MDKVKEEVEKQIECLTADGLEQGNVKMLGMLVDIHKDLANEEYWKGEMEMRYNDYGRRGRYNDRGYGRRGRYRGDDPMEAMQEYYENYSEAQNEMYSGNYGAEGEMVKSVEGIMKNVYKIIEELAQADSPEVMKIIQHYAHKIQEME